MKITIFCDVILCSPVEVYRNFTNIKVNFYQITWGIISQKTKILMVITCVNKLGKADSHMREYRKVHYRLRSKGWLLVSHLRIPHLEQSGKKKICRSYVT